jgi:hypothetical protein
MLQKQRAGIHKSPYMAARFILITEAADITLGDFLHNVFTRLGVHGGAAQDIDLFPDARSLFGGFMRL